MLFLAASSSVLVTTAIMVILVYESYSFFTHVVKHCDRLVDFHTGSFDRSNLPQVRADLTLPDVLEFTRGFGATTVLHSAGTRTKWT